jgi:hypothetical protein
MRPAIPVLLLVFTFLTACELPIGIRPGLADMLESRAIEVPDGELVWEIVKLEFEQAGMGFDMDRTIPSEGTFETHWVEELAPYRFDGRRSRVVGQILPDPESPGFFRVYMTTWVQRNADMDDPFDSQRAIWQDVEPDLGLTRQFIYRIERHFFD